MEGPGQTGIPHAHRLDQPAQVERGGFSSILGLVAMMTSSTESFIRCMSSRARMSSGVMLSRGEEGAVEHVVQAPVLSRALERDHVPGFFHHADGLRLAADVMADLAGLGLGDVPGTRCSSGPSPSPPEWRQTAKRRVRPVPSEYGRPAAAAVTLPMLGRRLSSSTRMARASELYLRAWVYSLMNWTGISETRLDGTLRPIPGMLSPP